MHQPFFQTCVQLSLVFFLITHLARGSPIDNKEKYRYTITPDTENNIGDSIIATNSDQALSLRRKESNCFPAIGFKMPRELPSSLNGWWCDMSNEYAFVGFSYEVSECEFNLSKRSQVVTFLGQSFSGLKRDFTDIRQRFRGRYVRIYGACDKQGF